MKPFNSYLNCELNFWDEVRLISETLGYSSKKELKTYTMEQIDLVENDLEINLSDKPLLLKYLNERSEILNSKVQNFFMDKSEVQKIYKDYIIQNNPKSKIIMNKQKGDKKHPSYLSNLVSFGCEKVFDIGGFVNDPQKLCYIIDNDKIIKTFARRFDGALPSIKNPKAVWEVKEYYGTTSFGSRVADGVYETLLDGLEINQIKTIKHRPKHFLFIDDKFTWWGMGKSYLCRIIDMLNMKLVDEVFFGKEVITEWPKTLKKLN
ncbi:DUF7687 domain-containing protein [Candidatus Pelagibacter communis]|uniref:DUF7687 domain-containing protein n=1 Tax=Pelagibacter ubique TaxID=198252 RepID=UPI0003A95012|nr:hypothetical protein [Candidatus Pelagibacter ubique]